MACDLARLRIALDTAGDERAADERFRMRLAGHDVPEPPPPDQSDDEMAESALGVMQILRGISTDDD